MTKTMKTIYDIFDIIEKKPGMVLGHSVGITALDHFIQGYSWGGGRFYDKKSGYPDFSLFTDWLCGMIKYKHEYSSMNWHWHLLNKYKDEEKALKKFFDYLNQFKKSRYECMVVPLKKNDILYSIGNKTNALWCKAGNTSGSYYAHLKKTDKIILFKMTPSRTLFSLMVSKDGKVSETRNTDITGRLLRKKIEMQFGIDLGSYKAVDSEKSAKILRKYKIV